MFNYSRWYRTTCADSSRAHDMPKADNGRSRTTPRSQYPGRFPSHAEPYETPRRLWRRRRARTPRPRRRSTQPATANLIYSGTALASRSAVARRQLPARAHHHPVRRALPGRPDHPQQPWNVEVEPEPWIEINSADARAYGIADGDWVNVITARGDSVNQTASEPVARLPTVDTDASARASGPASASVSDTQPACRPGRRGHPVALGRRRVSRPALAPTTSASMRWMRTRRFPSPRPVSARSRRHKGGVSDG